MAKLIQMLRTQHSVRLQGLTIEADASHPNKLKFKGILTRLDTPSTKPPQGSLGHLIEMPSDIAQKRLSTLIGMGVNYSENLDSHEITHKVGVIEKAWIKGNALWVSGHVWVGDFPDAEKVLSTNGLGMSMELTHVLVEDRDADPWILSDFVFTGATFLRKSNAAYFDTEAIAASGSTSIFITTEAAMPKTNNNTRVGNKKKPATVTLSAQEQQLAKLTASAASASITRALGTPLAAIAASLERSNTVNEQILARLNAEDDMDEDSDVDDTTAAAEVTAGKSKTKKKPADDDSDNEDDFDEDEDDADDDDTDDDEDDVDSSNALVDAATEDGTSATEGEADTPGHVNEDAHDRHNTSTIEDKQGPVTAAAVTKWKNRATKWKNRAMKSAADLSALRAENSRLKARAETSGTASLTAAREATRKTLSSEALNVLSKNGVDAADLRASGQVMSTEEVDAMLANLPHKLDNENRISIKREFQSMGLMKLSNKTRA